MSSQPVQKISHWPKRVYFTNIYRYASGQCEVIGKGQYTFMRLMQCLPSD